MLSSGEGITAMYLVPCVLRNKELQGAGAGVPAEELHSECQKSLLYVVLKLSASCDALSASPSSALRGVGSTPATAL